MSTFELQTLEPIFSASSELSFAFWTGKWLHSSFQHQRHPVWISTQLIPFYKRFISISKVPSHRKWRCPGWLSLWIVNCSSEHFFYLFESIVVLWSYLPRLHFLKHLSGSSHFIRLFFFLLLLWHLTIPESRIPLRVFRSIIHHKIVLIMLSVAETALTELNSLLWDGYLQDRLCIDICFNPAPWFDRNNI